MINNEIIIRQAELQTAIATLKAMQMGTRYGKWDLDNKVMNTSISETSDAVTEMFRMLQNTEKAFQELLQHTIQAMEVAGVSFELADISAGQIFQDLPYAIIL